MARRFALKPVVLRETPLQQMITAALRLEIAPPGKVSAHGVVWWAVDIACYGGSTPGLRTSRGVIAGVPDLFFLWRGVCHFIELKAADGVLSEAQQHVAAAVLAAGGKVGVATSIDQVLACLDTWRVPRARRCQLAA